jgi:hypothetical protein
MEWAKRAVPPLSLVPFSRFSSVGRADPTDISIQADCSRPAEGDIYLPETVTKTQGENDR